MVLILVLIVGLAGFALVCALIIVTRDRPGQEPYARVVIDAYGVVEHWSSEAEALFGWSYLEVLDRKISDFLIPQRYVERHEAGLKRLLTERESRLLGRDLPTEAMHRDGREVKVLLIVNRLRGHNGGARYVATITPRDSGERAILTPQGIVETPAEAERASLRAKQEAISELLGQAQVEMLRESRGREGVGVP